MGLYIKDKKKFLELCEDFYDNGNGFFVIGHDKHGNLRGEVNTNASEVSLGRLLFDARQNKLFGCGLTHCEELQIDKVAEEWGKFNGVIIPESSLINWEQRHYEIAKELFVQGTSLYFTNKDYRIMTNEGAFGDEDWDMSEIIWSDEASNSIAIDAIINADTFIQMLKNKTNND